MQRFSSVHRDTLMLLEESSFGKNKNDVNSLNLNRVVFIGRTFSEYIDMFNLDLDELKGMKILDCPSGASSFIFESIFEHQIKNVVGCDVMYESKDSNNLEKIADNDLKHMAKKLAETVDYYKWDQYRDIYGLLDARNIPLKKFLLDYPSGYLANRYVYAKLPNLPFENKKFDLVLSGNLLFYYHDIFNYDFHLQSILEFIRVSRNEVRIFPVVTPNGMIPVYFDRLLSDLRQLSKTNIEYEIRKVRYHFRKGVDKMIVLRNCS